MWDDDNGMIWNELTTLQSASYESGSRRWDVNVVLSV